MRSVKDRPQDSEGNMPLGGHLANAIRLHVDRQSACLLPKGLLRRGLCDDSRGTEQHARVTHHRSLCHGHGRNMRQAGVWPYSAVRGAAGRVSRISLNVYVRDQESLAWFQFGLQGPDKPNAEHPDELIVLPEPEDTLGGTLWPHTTLQQHHCLLLQDTPPDPTGRACGVLLRV